MVGAQTFSLAFSLMTLIGVRHEKPTVTDKTMKQNFEFIS
jgi:hypothetical protein